jgi:hypothetical protein
VYAFGYLDEWALSDYSNLRSSSTEPSPSDVVIRPKWVRSTPLTLRLCTDGSAISGSGLAYCAAGSGTAGNPRICFFDADTGDNSDNESQRDSQLLADTNAAINEWALAAANTNIAVNTVSTVSSCGITSGSPYGGNNGTFDLFFNNKYDDGSSIPNGVVAFTILTYTLEPANQRLRIIDSDIVFNTNETFVTDAWISDRYGSSVPSGIGRWSYQGVLVHELGHLFGLAHSFVTDDNDSDGITTGASMYPVVSDLRQTLSIAELQLDDILGLKNLYATSSTFAAAPYQGTLSGKLTRSGLRGQRGAQVTVFSTEDNRSYAATYSGMSGTAESSEGQWQIRGLPLNHDFIVFIEDADRIGDSSFPNWRPRSVNNVMKWALGDAPGNKEVTGWRNFSLEAFPDAEIVDIRDSRDVSAFPGISNAETIRLSSSTKSRTDIDFFVSNTFLPPNDDFQFIQEITNKNDTGSGGLLIKNSAPLQLSFSYTQNFSTLLDIEVDVTATNLSSDSTVDLNGGLPSWSSWTSSDALITLKPPTGGLSDGDYRVNAQMSAVIDGERVILVDGARVIEVDGWTSGSSSIVFGPNQAGASSGGGCSLKSNNSRLSNFINVFGLMLLFFIIGIRIRRRAIN